MSALMDVYFKKETLKTLFETLDKKGEKGVSITFSINDETNEYGQNVNSYVAQTKEQREAKANRFFTGNGKVFWTNGTIKKSDPKGEASDNKPAPEKAIPAASDDLPF